ncbi:MAG TPA: phosphatase PAP2 family protein [Patescibacteria group bacterium]|jgi:undecaprenyl-diphosphatase|nr:phosphatase PAP2 family protein [Patescibacteria group bacterium]
MIQQSTYHKYQEQLANSKEIRYFWQFWSNYSFVFFFLAVVVMIANPQMRPFARPVVILMIFSFLIARGLLVTIINIFYERRRPYQEFNFAPITSKFFSFRTSYPNSFPSRHTTAYFAIATVVCLFFPALGASLVAVSLMAGAGRVILGFHWPSDIVAGAILGTIIGYLTVAIGYSILFTK